MATTKPANSENTILLPKGTTRKQAAKALETLPSTVLQKGFNAKKYFDTMKWGQDALAFQRELRED
ncbi:MAG: hypothetical protein LH609_20220 [Rudanella sp.]|nr:hypothetical protein [Rudanella sp.]